MFGVYTWNMKTSAEKNANYCGILYISELTNINSYTLSILK